MSAIKLDKSKVFAQIYGDTEGRHYEQGGRYFRADTTLWVDPNAPQKKESAAEKAEREKAEAEEAARQKATESKADKEGDQLSQQLGG